MKKLLMIIPLVILICFTFGCQKQTEELAEETKEEVTSGTVNIDGFELSYSIEGTGIPVVVLNGRLYHPPVFSKELRKHIKFIFADVRCFIPLDTPDDMNTITIDTYVDDIEQTRIALGFDKIAVLGHSAFGFLSLEYARKYPQHTSHAILIATPPYFTTSKYNSAAAEFWESDASQERKAILKRNQEKLTEETLNSVSPDQAFIMGYLANAPKFWYDPSYDASWIVEAFDEFNVDLVNHFYGVILNDYDITGSFHQITKPVFLALGRYDYWAPFYLWDDEKNKLPNLSYNLFEKSGHWPFLEEQELFDTKLIDWIKSH